MNKKTVQHLSDIARSAFPKHADIFEKEESGDLCLFVDWKLGTDPAHLSKRSKSIEVRISKEAMSDYANGTDSQRKAGDVRLMQYLKNRLASFDPEHDTRPEVPRPRERWVVSTAMLNP